MLDRDLVPLLNEFLGPEDIDQLQLTHTSFSSLHPVAPQITLVTHLLCGAHETYTYKVAPQVYHQQMICHGICNTDGTIEMRSNYLTYGKFIPERHLYSMIDLSHQSYYQFNLYDHQKQLLITQDVNDYLFLNVHQNEFGLVDSLLIHFLEEDVYEEEDYDW